MVENLTYLRRLCPRNIINETGTGQSMSNFEPLVLNRAKGSGANVVFKDLKLVIL